MPKLAAPVCAKSTGRMTASDPPNVVANAFGLHLATISSLTSVPDHKNNLGCLWWTHMLVRVKSLMKVCMNFLMKMKELDIKITGAKFDNILCRLTLDNGTWNYVKLASCFNCVSSVIQYIKGGKVEVQLILDKQWFGLACYMAGSCLLSRIVWCRTDEGSCTARMIQSTHQGIQWQRPECGELSPNFV